MAVTLYDPNGGPITISPVMEGLMNCGYTLDAYKTGSIVPFISISGDIEHVHPMTFDSPSIMGDKTRIACSFLFRAGNSSVVGSSYKLGVVAKQNGVQLEEHEESDPNDTLQEDVQSDGYILIFKSK